METDHRLIKEGGATGRSSTGGWMRRAGVLLLLSFAAGCAVTQQSTPEPVVEQPPVVEKKTIERLDGGRMGFIITETADPSAAWRGDFERAAHLMQDSGDAEAIPILEEIVRQSPGVTAPYINLAMAYRHTEQFGLAEEQLQAALQLVPDHPVANNEYGLLLRQTGRFKEAREVYEATLLMFPEYLPVRLNLGILCELYLSDNACALEQYVTYSEANPDDDVVALWLAGLKLRMGHN